MEFDLVENSVKVAEVQEAFQATLDYEDFVSNENTELGDRDPRKLSLTGFSVALNSMGGNGDEYLFSGSVNQILKEENERFADVRLELILFLSTEQCVDKYGVSEECARGSFILSGMEKGDSVEGVNIIERLEHAFGENEVHFDIELSLAHLPTLNSPVSLDKVIILKATKLKYCSHPDRISGHVRAIPLTVNSLWLERTGFIRGKLSVKAKLDQDAANYFHKFGNCSRTEILEDLNQKLAGRGVPSDLEFQCKNGAVVKCNSALLLPTANEWQKKLEKDLRDSRTRPLAVKMELSEEGVKGFLEWINCNKLTKALVNSEVAVELLKASRLYEVKELETEMEKLLMSKRAKDLKYFSVEAALNLYIHAKDVWELEDLRDKAVRVLKYYIKEAGDKLNESVEYQNFFRNNIQEAMKLSHLYASLS